MARVRPIEISDFSTVDWQETARLLLKRHLGGVRYQALAAQLAKIGVQETEHTIANKLSRGAFSLTFFVQCMIALGVDPARWAEENFVEVSPSAALQRPEQL